MILMIDNYDSFTYNLVQYLRELGQEIIVHRNDQITVSEIRQLSPEAIVVSPGPCTPNEAGVSLETVATLQGEFQFLAYVLGTRALVRVLAEK